jgi:uncharacterized protein with von Willebrand factor type A (vWA) domain
MGIEISIGSRIEAFKAIDKMHSFVHNDNSRSIPYENLLDDILSSIVLKSAKDEDIARMVFYKHFKIQDQSVLDKIMSALNAKDKLKETKKQEKESDRYKEIEDEVHNDFLDSIKSNQSEDDSEDSENEEENDAEGAGEDEGEDYDGEEADEGYTGENSASKGQFDECPEEDFEGREELGDGSDEDEELESEPKSEFDTEVDNFVDDLMDDILDSDNSFDMQDESYQSKEDALARLNKMNNNQLASIMGESITPKQAKLFKDLMKSQQEAENALSQLSNDYNQDVNMDVTSQEMNKQISEVEQSSRNLDTHDQRTIKRLMDTIKNYIRENENFERAMLGDTFDNIENRTDNESDQILHRDLRYIDPIKLEEIVKKLAKKICDIKEQEQIFNDSGDTLDIYETLSDSLSANIRSSLTNLVYESIQEDSPNLLIVCDLSGSMRSYVDLFLNIVYHISKILDAVQITGFSDRSVILHDIIFSKDNMKDKEWKQIFAQVEKLIPSGMTRFNGHIKDILYWYEHNSKITINQDTTIIFLSDMQSTDGSGDILSNSIVTLKNMCKQMFIFSPVRVNYNYADVPCYIINNLYDLEQAINMLITK